MNDFVEEFREHAIDLSHYEDWQMWLVGGAGVALLLVGYRIKQIAFFVIWFLLGYIATGYLMPMLNNMVPEIAESNVWQGLLPIGGGILVGLMGFMVEKVCLGGICFGLTIMMTAQYFGTDIQTMVIGAVVGTLLGGAAVMMMKPATIIATAVAGAYALTLAILTLGSNIDSETMFWPMILGFSILGSAFQFYTARHS